MLLGLLVPLTTLAFAFSVATAIALPYDTPNARRLWLRIAAGVFVVGAVVLTVLRASSAMDADAAVAAGGTRGALALQVLGATVLGGYGGYVFGTIRGRRLEERQAQRLRDRMPVEQADPQRDIHPVLASGMSEEEYERVRAYNEQVARERAAAEEAERAAREAGRRGLRRSTGGRGGPGRPR